MGSADIETTWGCGVQGTAHCGVEGTGNRYGELPLMLQPRPHRGTGLIRGELLHLAQGAALLQSSGTPRSKAQGQCGDGSRLRGQSQV